jgi:2-oxoglutarate ferredoxin oxidoreductase subunit alpha
VAHFHLRNIWPLPRGLAELVAGFKQVIVPELNNGQLVHLLRSQLLVDAQGINKIQGQPFRISELVEEIRRRVGQGGN